MVQEGPGVFLTISKKTLFDSKWYEDVLRKWDNGERMERWKTLLLLYHDVKIEKKIKIVKVFIIGFWILHCLLKKESIF